MNQNPETPAPSERSAFNDSLIGSTVDVKSHRLFMPLGRYIVKKGGYEDNLLLVLLDNGVETNYHVPMLSALLKDAIELKLIVKEE